jgi:hypothetical protein
MAKFEMTYTLNLQKVLVFYLYYLEKYREL